MVKVWNLHNCRLRTNLIGHTGYVNTVTVSPDGIALRLWRQRQHRHAVGLERGQALVFLDAGEVIHSLVFSPNRYWLCAATTEGIKIWVRPPYSRQCAPILSPTRTINPKTGFGKQDRCG